MRFYSTATSSARALCTGTLSNGAYIRERGVGLGLTFRPGEDFYIGDIRFIVTQVASSTSFTIKRDHDGQEFFIVDDGRGAEILPDIIARVGARGQGNLARVVFTAPRTAIILTGRNYRRTLNGST